MAAYPSIGMRTSKRPINSRTTVDRSDAGGLRLVDTGATDLFEITVEHPLINSTDRTTFWTFFNTYRTTSNTITLGGTSHTVWFSEYPAEEQINGSYWNITVKLVGSA